MGGLIRASRWYRRRLGSQKSRVWKICRLFNKSGSASRTTGRTAPPDEETARSARARTSGGSATHLSKLVLRGANRLSCQYHIARARGPERPRRERTIFGAARSRKMLVSALLLPTRIPRKLTLILPQPLLVPLHACEDRRVSTRFPCRLHPRFVPAYLQNKAVRCDAPALRHRGVDLAEGPVGRAAGCRGQLPPAPRRRPGARRLLALDRQVLAATTRELDSDRDLRR